VRIPRIIVNVPGLDGSSRYYFCYRIQEVLSECGPPLIIGEWGIRSAPLEQAAKLVKILIQGYVPYGCPRRDFKLARRGIEWCQERGCCGGTPGFPPLKLLAKAVFNVVTLGKGPGEPEPTTIFMMVRVLGPWPATVLGAPPEAVWSGSPVK